MLYTPVTKKALKFCFEKHAGQVDHAGIPYPNHPLHLAEQMETEDETCVALLHDVMEDCGVTEGELRELGISERAIQALRLLTHAKEVPYLDYVRAIASDPIARKVKIADLRHNSTLARLDEVTPKDVERFRKYCRARVILGDMAEELATPFGPISLAVEGEPFPFAVHDETCEPAAYVGSASDEVLEHVGQVFETEADVLPLAVGSKVFVRCDLGQAVAQQESGNVVSLVGQKDGTTLGIGFSHAGADDASTVRFIKDECAYLVAADPVAARYSTGASKFSVQVAWREGIGKKDIELVEAAISR